MKSINYIQLNWNNVNRTRVSTISTCIVVLPHEQQWMLISITFLTLLRKVYNLRASLKKEIKTWVKISCGNVLLLLKNLLSWITDSCKETNLSNKQVLPLKPQNKQYLHTRESIANNCKKTVTYYQTYYLSPVCQILRNFTIANTWKFTFSF